MDSLRVELTKVETQIRLLRSVLWWYILPILAGSLVFYFGVNRNVKDRIVTVIVFVAMGWFLEWINKRAVRRYLVPLKTELESLLAMATQQGPKL